MRRAKARVFCRAAMAEAKGRNTSSAAFDWLRIASLGAMPYRNSGIDLANGVLDKSFAVSVFAQPWPTVRLPKCGVWSLPVLLALAGCVTAPKMDTNVKTDIQHGQTYLDSQGASASKERMAKNLSDTVLKRREQVAWGGVTFFGSGDLALSMPRCTTNVAAKFQAALVAKLGTANPRMFELKYLGRGLGDNMQSDAAIIMVAALIQDEVSTRRDPIIDGNTRVELSISGQVLFVDSKAAMQVIAAYPVGVVQFDSVAGSATPELLASMAKEALMGTKRLPDGKAASLCDQIVDLLDHEATVPRSLYPPAAVSRVELSPTISEANGPRGLVQLGQDTTKTWPDTFAAIFSTYLGANSGFPMNPYMPSGELKISSDRVLSAAANITMRSADNQQLNAKLRPPKLLFKLKVDSLCASLNPKKSKTFMKVVNYGFNGSVTVVSPDTGTEVLSIPIEFPPKNAGGLPAKLVLKYEELASVKFTAEEFQGDSINHAEIWRDRIDIFLGQLAREIAFREEDHANRFEIIRTQIKKNAQLINPISEFAGND